MQYLIGIDEAGRGPLAGPVSVGAVMVPHDFDFELLRGARDSKKLSEKKREEWYERLLHMKSDGVLNFAVALSPAASIDEEGIVPAIRSALSRCLDELRASPEACEIRLDGSLFAPDTFPNQKTIIRGDDTEPVISIASIAAKVTRDRYMMSMATQYPTYRFDEHKGYGTAAHRRLIAEHGFCEIHRRSFCTRLTVGTAEEA
ncbi:ribonuclease HII [Candidatus Kaiserbacteria bacterium]|nr:ribonuclease HII [Candidatus Kaiserbacteria bacterium]